MCKVLRFPRERARPPGLRTYGPAEVTILKTRYYVLWVVNRAMTSWDLNPLGAPRPIALLPYFSAAK